MAQHDYDIANQSGSLFRADLNNVLSAIVSGNSGASAPATTFAYMWWNDTTNGLRKQRNAANTAWIIRGSLHETRAVAESSGFTVGVDDYGKFYSVTGTTTATLTAAATLGAGFWFLLRNGGSATVTIDPNASETINGQSTWVLQPGEWAVAWCDGSNWLCITGTQSQAHGECRFNFTSSTVCTLLPYDGNHITISGITRQLPSAGVTIGNGSLSASTFYYIYAYWTGSAVALEASTTGHATDTATGVEIKSGDASRTLVGAVYIASGGTFQDSEEARFVISWFNRRKARLKDEFSADRTTTSTTTVELNTEIQVFFISWGTSGDIVIATYTGVSSNDTAGAYTATSISLDGSTDSTESIGTSSTGGYYVPTTPTFVFSSPSEGAFHYLTLKGRVGSGTGRWYANYSLTAEVTI